MDRIQECGLTQAWEDGEKSMVEGQGSQVMMAMRVLLNMDMERGTMRRELGQAVPLEKRNGVLSVTGRVILIGVTVMRGNKTGTGQKGSTGTRKRKIVTVAIGKGSVTRVMRMIGIEGTLLQELGADPVRLQKKITGLEQGM
jgi:hypothetical protein